MADWTERDSGFGGSEIWAVKYANNVWVAVGAGGKISTSPDGITWTLRATTGNLLRYVAFGNGVWVAASEFGAPATIYTSTDNGATWTLAYTIDDRLYSLTFGNGVFVIAASKAFLLPSPYSRWDTLTSTDGSTWSLVSITSAPQGTLYEFPIHFGNGLFQQSLVISTAAFPYTYGLRLSTDAVTWTEYTVATGQGTGGLTAVYDNGKWLAEEYGFVTTSTDGIDWTALSTLPLMHFYGDDPGDLYPVYQSRSYDYNLAYFDGLWMAGLLPSDLWYGQDFDTDPTPPIPVKVAVSTDGGATWAFENIAEVPYAPFGSPSGAAVAVYGNGLWLASTVRGIIYTRPAGKKYPFKINVGTGAIPNWHAIGTPPGRLKLRAGSTWYTELRDGDSPRAETHPLKLKMPDGSWRTVLRMTQ